MFVLPKALIDVSVLVGQPLGPLAPVLALRFLAFLFELSAHLCSLSTPLGFLYPPLWASFIHPFGLPLSTPLGFLYPPLWASTIHPFGLQVSTQALGFLDFHTSTHLWAS